MLPLAIGMPAIKDGFGNSHALHVSLDGLPHVQNLATSKRAKVVHALQ